MTALPLPLCIVMENAINGLLALDENSRQNAVPLSGKTLKIELSDLNLSFFFCISGQQDILIMSYGENPDVVICASSVNLAKMSTLEDANRMVLNQDVTITGDVATVSKVQEFFASVHIDWEEHLSRLTGDLIAHKISSGLRAGASWIRNSVKSLSSDVSEYARYEAEWLPDNHESDGFIKQVNQLRNDVDRLEAKIKRLVHKLNSQKH